MTTARAVTLLISLVALASSGHAEPLRLRAESAGLEFPEPGPDFRLHTFGEVAAAQAGGDACPEAKEELLSRVTQTYSLAVLADAQARSAVAAWLGEPAGNREPNWRGQRDRRTMAQRLLSGTQAIFQASLALQRQVRPAPSLPRVDIRMIVVPMHCSLRMRVVHESIPGPGVRLILPILVPQEQLAAGGTLALRSVLVTLAHELGHILQLTPFHADRLSAVGGPTFHVPGEPGSMFIRLEREAVFIANTLMRWAWPDNSQEYFVASMWAADPEAYRRLVGNPVVASIMTWAYQRQQAVLGADFLRYPTPSTNRRLLASAAALVQAHHMVDKPTQESANAKGGKGQEGVDDVDGTTREEALSAKTR